MANTTDTIVRLALLLFAVQGFFKGFLAVLIGPLALLLGVFSSVYYYARTEDIIKTLVVSIAAPILINILLSLVLKIWKITFGKNGSLSWQSRVSGATISAAWGGIYLGMLLLLLAMLPTAVPQMQKIKDDVTHSGSSRLVTHLTRHIKPLAALNTTDVLETLRDPQKMEWVQKTEQFQDLQSHEGFKNFLEDPAIAEQIRNQDINGLLKNPKFKSLLTDKDLMKKLMAMNQKIIEEKSDEVRERLKNAADPGGP